jgi:hypothetical protein
MCWSWHSYPQDVLRMMNGPRQQTKDERSVKPGPEAFTQNSKKKVYLDREKVNKDR